MNKRNCCISSMQKRIMFDFLKERPLLVSGKFSPTFKYKDAENCWIELTNLLNAIPGPHKEWKTWRKTWQDLRSRAKIKYRRIEFRAETKLPNEECLSQTEQDIINLIQGNCLYDDSSSEINLQEEDSDIQEFIVISSVPDKHHHDEMNVCEKCNFEINDSGVIQNDSSTEESLITTNNTPEEPHKIINISGKQINFKNERIEIINEEVSNLEKEEKTHKPSSINNKLIKISRPIKTRLPRNRFASVKREYHSKKLKLLERLIIAKERSAAANERSAVAKEQIAASLGSLVRRFDHPNKSS